MRLDHLLSRESDERSSRSRCFGQVKVSFSYCSILRALQKETSGKTKKRHPIAMAWGYSSVGRAPALHAGGRRFDSVYLHQTIMLRIISERKRKRLRVRTGYDPAITKVIALLQLNRDGRKFFSRRQVDKSIGWMPWRRKAMKDVVSCEKLRGGANIH